jgi:hypothetical protein
LQPFTQLFLHQSLIFTVRSQFSCLLVGIKWTRRSNPGLLARFI